MASNIVPGNVDGTFPVAGKDNSSQGFRDNFTAIKNNFTNAKTEIETLQTHSVKTNEANNFNDNVVSRAVLKDTSETIYAHGTTSGNITINHESGHYQTMTTNGAVVLAFTIKGYGIGSRQADNTTHQVKKLSDENIVDGIYINWDGKNKSGKNLPSDTYYYNATVTFDVLDENESIKEIKGWVQILR